MAERLKISRVINVSKPGTERGSLEIRFSGLSLSYTNDSSLSHLTLIYWQCYTRSTQWNTFHAPETHTNTGEHEIEENPASIKLDIYIYIYSFEQFCRNFSYLFLLIWNYNCWNFIPLRLQSLDQQSTKVSKPCLERGSLALDTIVVTWATWTIPSCTPHYYVLETLRSQHMMEYS